MIMQIEATVLIVAFLIFVICLFNERGDQAGERTAIMGGLSIIMILLSGGALLLTLVWQ